MVGFSRPAGRPVVLHGARRLAATMGLLEDVGLLQGGYRVPVSNVGIFLCRHRVLLRVLVVAQIVVTRCLLMMVCSGLMMGGCLVMVRRCTKTR